MFRALEDLADFDFEFAADEESVAGILIIDHHELKKRAHLRNVRLGRILWQIGAVSEAARRRHDAYIYVGDASITSTWIAAVIARVNKRPVLFWTIGWHRPETGAKRVIRLTFYRLADRLLLYGHIGRQIGLGCGYPERKMSVIGNSVTSLSGDVNETSGIESISQLPRGRAMVGAVIRLTPQKRLDLLIQAVAVISRSHRPVSVLLVGDGPEKERLRRLATTLGVDLHLIGPLYTDEAIASVYRHMSVTVVPAAIGLTAIQSLSHGVPVISDDDRYAQMPEWEAIIEGVTGGTYRSGDVSSLATTITSWLDRMESEAADVRSDCRREVDARWTPQAQAGRIAAALLELLPTGGSR